MLILWETFPIIFAAGLFGILLLKGGGAECSVIEPAMIKPTHSSSRSQKCLVLFLVKVFFTVAFAYMKIDNES